jgi:hypothetical protein
MSISPFESDQDGGFNLAKWSAPAALDDQAFDTIGQTVRHAAGAIDGLRDILERLHSSVEQATEQRRHDIAIGSLFTRAQEFADDAVREGHQLAQRIIADAEFEAGRIIGAAKVEAHRLVEEGRHSAALPPGAVRALQATIEEFGRMNSALALELTTLARALARTPESRLADPTPGLSAETSPEAGPRALSFTPPPIQGPWNEQPVSAPSPIPAPAWAPALPPTESPWTEQPRSAGIAPETEDSPPTGYWSSLQPTREDPSTRSPRRSEPGARWPAP